MDGGGAHRPPLLQQRQHCHVRLCHRRHRCCCCSPPPTSSPLSPPLRHMTLGDGAFERAHYLYRIGQGGGSISSGDGKKVKHHGIVRRVMHDFYVKINPREKSGDAVACASVAPVQLHCLIRHKGKNTWRIIAARRRNGGGGDVITLLIFFGRSLPVWGLFLEAREDIPKNNF